MQALKDKIVHDGLALGTQIIKVDSFLNHQLDIDFIMQIGQEFKRRFGDLKPNKILTMESSGIACAMAVSMAYGNIPVVFAKKITPSTLVEEAYRAEIKSFTKGIISQAVVSSKFINPGDKLLIIDDFMAHGEAAKGLISIAKQGGAEVLGYGVVIEKEFQGGGNKVRQSGVRLESLAIIKEINDGVITFRN